MEYSFKWRDYLHSEEFEIKEDFDVYLLSSSGYKVVLSSASITLYAIDLYPKSLFLIIIGSLDPEKVVKLLADSPMNPIFIKARVQSVNNPRLEKIFDSLDINHMGLGKTSVEELTHLQTLDSLDEVLNFYVRNHCHHLGTNKKVLSEVFKGYSIQKLSGHGFSVYFEDQGDFYETSLFSTDGKGKSVENLIKQLENMGRFKMELDSNLGEFNQLMESLKNSSSYGRSLFRIKQ